MRPLARALVVCVAASYVAGAPASAGAPARRSIRAADRMRAVDGTRHRVDELVAEARSDRLEALVDVYRRYPDDVLRDPRRGVTLGALLDVVASHDAPHDVRRRAAETIFLDRVLGNDPTLDMNGRRGSRPREIFSAKVRAILDRGDELGRRLAADILEGLWPGRASRRPRVK